MNSRERFLRTINRKVPDRSPVFATFTPQVAQKMAAFINMPHEEPLDSMLSTRASHMDLLVELGNNAVGIAICEPDDFSKIYANILALKTIYLQICKYQKIYHGILHLE